MKTHVSQLTHPNWISTAICESFPSFFNWRNQRRIGRLVDSFYRTTCEAQTIQCLSKTGDKELLSFYSLLSRRKFRDVVSAPRIAWRILDDNYSYTKDSGVLLEALVCEALACKVLKEGLTIQFDHTLYSARCNLVFEPDGEEKQCTASLKKFPFYIDIQKSLNIFMTTGNAVKAVPYRDEKQKEGLKKLQLALEQINNLCPIAYFHICDTIDILALRERQSSIDFETGTFSGCAGLVLFTNIHLGTLQDYMEGLIHEAVHCTLYRYEAVFGDFILDHSYQDCPVKSPWSGKDIRLHSFIHACIVWYAIFNFWKVNKQNILEIEETSFRISTAHKGFFQSPASKIIARYHRIIDPGILKVLVNIEKEMLLA
jgi:hypothetical protein